jgi:hypothetical protein
VHLLPRLTSAALLCPALPRGAPELRALELDGHVGVSGQVAGALSGLTHLKSLGLGQVQVSEGGGGGLAHTCSQQWGQWYSDSRR